MKSETAIATYSRMHEQPMWKLLASDNAPAYIGLLQAHLYDGDRKLSASVLHERIGRDLEWFRARGVDLPQSAQAYVASWLSNGYLERRFPAGASEEEYELSTATIEVIRFLSGVVQPHSVATESRLSLVISALVRLAKDTDDNPERRIEHLLTEKARLDQEIEAIQAGRMRVLDSTSALERIREVITLADELAGDFRHVRDQFENLNRDLREKIMNDDGSRGEVLDSLFAGIDLIAESEAGKTFSAFWRLLTDPEESATLNQALEGIFARKFVSQLSSVDRRFLLCLTQTLLEQGGSVHEVLQSFARNLRRFVQSKEFLEQRRINQLLKDAQRSAHVLKDSVKATETLSYTLELTSSRIRSYSQWALYDPALKAPPGQMDEGDAATIPLEAIVDLVSESEIDFEALKADIRVTLETQSQASISNILERFPASQGLGSVVGLMALGSRHGLLGESHEKVVWVGGDNQRRSATIPTIFFLRERVNELK